MHRSYKGSCCVFAEKSLVFFPNPDAAPERQRYAFLLSILGTFRRLLLLLYIFTFCLLVSCNVYATRSYFHHLPPPDHNFDIEADQKLLNTCLVTKNGNTTTTTMHNNVHLYTLTVDINN